MGLFGRQLKPGKVDRGEKKWWNQRELRALGRPRPVIGVLPDSIRTALTGWEKESHTGPGLVCKTPSKMTAGLVEWKSVDLGFHSLGFDPEWELLNFLKHGISPQQKRLRIEFVSMETGSRTAQEISVFLPLSRNKQFCVPRRNTII